MVTIIESCFDLQYPTNGDIIYEAGSTNSRPLGTEATYSCDGTTIRCQLQRMWSQSAPECACTCLLSIYAIFQVIPNHTLQFQSVWIFPPFLMEISIILLGWLIADQ